MSIPNEAIAFYDSGEDITGFCTAAVTGKRFVKISGARTGGPHGVSDDITGGNVKVAPAGAGDKVFGVATYDQLINKLVPVARAMKVMPVTAGGALSAGQEVQSDATGKAVVLSTGKAAGYVLDDCASGNDAQVVLYP